MNTALHEFGHAAGLLHEHSRSDVSATCKEYTGADGKETGVKIVAESIGGTIQKVGKYDELSIMNYCLLAVTDSLGEIAKLSPGDIIGINTLYPTANAKEPAANAQNPVATPAKTASGKTKDQQDIIDNVIYCDLSLLPTCIIDNAGGAGCLELTRSEQECSAKWSEGRVVTMKKETSKCIFSKQISQEKFECVSAP